MLPNQFFFFKLLITRKTYEEFFINFSNVSYEKKTN